MTNLRRLIEVETVMSAQILAGAERDELLDRLDALPPGVHRVRQSAPGVFPFLDGSSVQVDLPPVGQRFPPREAPRRIELSTPLAPPAPSSNAPDRPRRRRRAASHERT